MAHEGQGWVRLKNSHRQKWEIRNVVRQAKVDRPVLNVVSIALMSPAGVIQFVSQYFEQARLLFVGRMAVGRRHENAIYPIIELLHRSSLTRAGRDERAI